MTRLTALGITCGIGSMLGAARQAGFEVLGNHEWRKYYHKKDPDGKNTFRENFPGAYFVEKYPQQGEKFSPKVDVVYGHPECGSFSALNFSNKGYKEQQQTASDIPLFLHAIATVKPRFFVMDDLPRAFIGLPMSEYHMILPEYDLFPEWVSNYHYGNVQLNRKRMFMIGALKSERWAFRPGEFRHEKTVKDVIG
jgi:site-specific DNA-cytosine methylase